MPYTGKNRVIRFNLVTSMSTGLERLIEVSKKSVDKTYSEIKAEEAKDKMHSEINDEASSNLEDSLKLLIERDNAMADAAEKALDRL